MKIGIIRLSVLGGKATNSTYNYQCIGLAKALGKLGHEVDVYRCIEKGLGTEHWTINKNVSVHEIEVPSIGNNGFFDVSIVDDHIDTVFIMSDIQLDAYRCIKELLNRGITVYPYLGVIESHSNKSIVRWIMSLLSKRLVCLYKKLKCYTKTPAMADSLKLLGINDVHVLPVGLDTDLLKRDYEAVASDVSCEIKVELGFEENDNIILFVGRLTEEKNPLRMLKLFDMISTDYDNVKLLMIGDGNLRDEVKRSASNRVKVIPQIDNSEMWKLFLVSKCMVNLNQQEIFGMAILEAMYYKCPVIACKAPGPEYIMDGCYGEFSGLVVTDAEILQGIRCCIEEENVKGVPKLINIDLARQRVIQQFTWEGIAKGLEETLFK